MFKISRNWLIETIEVAIKRNIDFDEILNILNLQGFEVKLVQDLFKSDSKKSKAYDSLITIEVKANRPDILSVNGLAREIVSFLGYKFREIKSLESSEISVKKENDFPLKVTVEPDSCYRFCACVIKNINNNVKTPELIKERLEVMGINSINAAIDIQNYKMLEFGQPAHVYDINKIKNKKIDLCFAKKCGDMLALNSKILKIQEKDLVIYDEEKPICIAGIVGSDSSKVEKNTTDILIETGVFIETSVRLTSRRLKVSTPSSFRFERGVNKCKTLEICKQIAISIQKICGGVISDSMFDFDESSEKNSTIVYFNEPNFSKDIDKNSKACITSQNKQRSIIFDVKKCNQVLGTYFSTNEIIGLLEKYDFSCETLNNSVSGKTSKIHSSKNKKIVEEEIKVLVPDFRLDVKIEEDLIEEVARSYGYDNIIPRMPSFVSQYQDNTNFDKTNLIRKIFIGLGFNEIITYSFIPDNFLSTFNIIEGNKFFSNIILQNPLSPSLALMRPTFVYSMMNSLAYNNSIGNQNLTLFEIGRVYFNNSLKDTGCEEFDTLAFVLSGNMIEKGFGIEKNVKYSFYDLVNYVFILLNEFNLKFELVKTSCPFFVNSEGFEIFIYPTEGNRKELKKHNKKNNIKEISKYIGILGQIDKEKFLSLIPNSKLCDSIFFCEMYLEHLNKTKKTLKYESKFPPIVRQYNFLVPTDVFLKDVINQISNSSTKIIKCEVKDIYENVNRYVLLEVIFRLTDRTLNSEEIQEIETIFLEKLNSGLKVTLKK